ncbi:MAG: hypothetical protein ACYTGW_04875 [Planctomycetota bacterium]|jgi:hypothetical protein
MLDLDKRALILYLQTIFWGGLLCVVDFKINGFDILNDVLGWALIAYGVFGLAKQPCDDVYDTMMMFARIVVALATVSAVVEQVDGNLWHFDTLIGAVILAGIYVFCRAMVRLCIRYSWFLAEASWRTTGVLFLVIYVIPLGFIYLGALAAIVTESNPFAFSLPPVWVIPVIVVFFIPLIHLFVSTMRMKREAEGMGGG